MAFQPPPRLVMASRALQPSSAVATSIGPARRTGPHWRRPRQPQSPAQIRWRAVRRREAGRLDPARVHSRRQKDTRQAGESGPDTQEIIMRAGHSSAAARCSTARGRAPALGLAVHGSSHGLSLRLLDASTASSSPAEYQHCSIPPDAADSDFDWHSPRLAGSLDRHSAAGGRPPPLSGGVPVPVWLASRCPSGSTPVARLSGGVRRPCCSETPQSNPPARYR